MFINVDYTKKEQIEYNFDRKECVIHLFSNKSKDWEHEEEVRLTVIGRKDRYLRFNPSFITGIIFGCRMEESEIDEIKFLAESKNYRLKYSKGIKDKYELKFKDI